MAQPRLSNFALLCISHCADQGTLIFRWDFSLHPEDGIICLVSSCSGWVCLSPLPSSQRGCAFISPHTKAKGRRKASSALSQPARTGLATLRRKRSEQGKTENHQSVLGSRLLGPLAVRVAQVNRDQATTVLGLPIYVDAPGSPPARVVSQCNSTA